MKKLGRIRRRDDRGVTLIEVVVSVLIVGLAFTPLLAGMSTAFKANQKAESSLYADNIASQCVEKLKSVEAESGLKDVFGVNVIGNSLTLSDITEGDKTYIATINYTDAGSVVNAEDKYSSISNISGEDKAQVDLGAGVDYSVLTNQAKSFKDMSAYDKSDPLDAAQYLTSKTTYVTLGYDSTNVRPDKFYIAYQVKYTFDSAAFESGKSSYTTDEVKDYYFNCPQAVMLYMSPIISESGTNKSGSSLSDSLYNKCKTELQKIAKTPKNQGEYSNVNNPVEKVVIKNLIKFDGITEPNITADSKVDCYIFTAGAKLNENVDGIIKLDVTNEAQAKNLTVFCSMGIEDDSTSGTYTLNSNLIKTAEPDEIPRMYNVTVTVKDKITENVEAVVKSTVIWNKKTN